MRLVRVSLPLARPFGTSAGVQSDRDVILVQVITDRSDGWGENVAGREPTYTAEFTAASLLALRDHLVPRLFAAEPADGARDVARLLGGVKGWPMAKCSLEAALLDAESRAQGVSLAEYLGATRTRIAPGVAVGLHEDVALILEEVALRLDEGYCRIKLKIEPGRDLEVVAAVRSRFGSELAVQVDANSAYTLADSEHLAGLDPFELLFIEQPLADDDLWAHAELGRRIRTPICLDESISSAPVAAGALTIGACSVINIKPGRVGGFLEAVKVHDLCVAGGVPAWCGGMLETGVGRAANLALAALPGFTLPPDLSASSRYFSEDITEPFELRDGMLDVPNGPGIGVAPDAALLRALGAEIVELRP